MKIQLGLFFTTLAVLGTSVIQAQDADEDYFKINIYDTESNITTSSWKQYDQNQNQGSNPLPVSVDDHTGLRTIGNKWSAYSIANPDGTSIDVHENTVLKFDFTLDEDTEKGFNAVCLDTDLEQTNPSGVINGKCIIMSSSQGWVSGNSYMNSNELTAVGTTSSQSVPIGQYLTGPVNYLVIIQDSDGTNRTIGDSTIHNLQIVDESRGKLKVEINAEEVELENNQLSYKSGGSVQDTTDWLMEVSEDGYGIQIVGNQWKALPLPSPYIVTPYTMIEVTATIGQKGEIHSICLDDDLSDNGSSSAERKNACVTLLLNQGGNGYYELNNMWRASNDGLLFLLVKFAV